MAQADSLLLSRYRFWRVFGSGTWSAARVPGRVHQQKVLFGFFYQVAKSASLPFSRLVWAARREYGEVGGREHYHWLIGADSWQPSVGDCFTMNALWDSFPKAGFSRNHLFNPELNGLDYICKCLSKSAFTGTVGGDFYESGKFGLDADVTLSNSFSRVVGGKRVCVDRCARL